MKRHVAAVLLVLAAALGWNLTALGQARNELFIPLLVYRTGPYAASGISAANGYRDYLQLVNTRDRGIQGVRIAFEECETAYDTKLGVACYEKLKNRGSGAAVVNPQSTGIAYELIPKAAADKIVIHTMGYGMTAAADGAVFPFVFNFPVDYWSEVSAFIRYIGTQEGGMDRVRGKKIALVYHNSPYGKEPIPTLEALKGTLGYELALLPVDHPGQEQKATWQQIRRLNPDWILLWGWGVMNPVALQEAAAIGFPMERMIGTWGSGSEADVIPAGDGAKGYKAGTFHAPGRGFKVHEEILKYVYKGDPNKAAANHFGEVLYNRQVVNAMYDVEAIRKAMSRYGSRPLTGEQYRWGFENLSLTPQDLAKLGFARVVQPLKVTCRDHEAAGSVMIQQWNGKAWVLTTDWIEPMSDLVRPMIEAAADKYAKANHITPRPCP
ncbi:MAG TPA: ABC transporter substrate-binding protein [bacterium]